MHGIHSACIAYASAAITQEEQVVLNRDLSRTHCIARAILRNLFYAVVASIIPTVFLFANVSAGFVI